MSTISEALKDLNDSMTKLICLYYKSLLMQYLETKDKHNKAKAKIFALNRSGHKVSDNEYGYANRCEKELKELKCKFPKLFDVDELTAEFNNLTIQDKAKTLTTEEKAEVERYLNKIETDLKLPKEKQQFKFSYLPIIYEVKRLEKDKIVYSALDEKREFDMSIDEFLKQKNQRIIEYKGRYIK